MTDASEAQRYQKFKVVLEKKIRRFMHFAGPESPFLNGINHFTPLCSLATIRLLHIDCLFISSLRGNSSP